MSFLTIIIIYICISCILSVEAISWIYTVFNHCEWMIAHNIEDKRRISYSTISILSIFSAIFSFISWILFIYVLALHMPFFFITILFLLISMFQIITIHSWFLISSFICVPYEFIPYISKFIIKILHSLFNKKYFEYIPVKIWEKVFEHEIINKSLLLNCLNIIYNKIENLLKEGKKEEAIKLFKSHKHVFDNMYEENLKDSKSNNGGKTNEEKYDRMVCDHVYGKNGAGGN